MGSPKIRLGKHKGAGGRPSKFTEETRNTILTAIRAGNYPLTAACYASITERTWYNWKQRAVLEEPGFLQFFQDVKKAEAFSEAHDLGIIGRCAMGSPIEYQVNAAGELVLTKDGKPVVLKEEKAPIWTAAAWRLERRSPEKYGRRFEGTIKGVGSHGEIVVQHRVVDLTKVSDEDLHTLRRIATEAQIEPDDTPETIH